MIYGSLSVANHFNQDSAAEAIVVRRLLGEIRIRIEID